MIVVESVETCTIPLAWQCGFFIIAMVVDATVQLEMPWCVRDARGGRGTKQKEARGVKESAGRERKYL